LQEGSKVAAHLTTDTGNGTRGSGNSPAGAAPTSGTPTKGNAHGAGKPGNGGGTHKAS